MFYFLFGKTFILAELYLLQNLKQEGKDYPFFQLAQDLEWTKGCPELTQLSWSFQYSSAHRVLLEDNSKRSSSTTSCQEALTAQKHHL